VPSDRRRLRELGFRVGRFPVGDRAAIVDVPGVRVGHVTLNEGDDVRTGVTAVLPHGDDVYEQKVLAGCHVVNGYGKATGLVQLAELGTLESPVLITGTLSVGAVWEGGLRHVLERNPEAGRRETVNVVVTECFDGWLGDARGLHVRPEHAIRAIASASADEAEEGSVGAGTGTTCFGLKAGVGTSSRLTLTEPSLTLGCLTVSNFGGRRDRHLLLGGPDGYAPGGPEDGGGGSAIVILASDAPLSERQLRRLAARGAFGLGRAGSFATNASGEFVIAFSTAQRVPHRSERHDEERTQLRDDSPQLRELFEIAPEVTHEAVLDSLCKAAPMEGRDGHAVEALCYELLGTLPGVTPI
jgi:D-aminopeptidase